jgi:hypothetical protein
VSVRPSVCPHRGSHWTEFCVIWYWSLWQKFIEKLRVGLKCDNIFRPFTWKPKYVSIVHTSTNCQSQWPCCLRRRFSVARLLRSWVRIPPRAWMFVVSVVCCQVEISVTDWSLVQRSPTDCGAPCVWSRNLENEEAKARYRAVENTTTMGCNARKTNNQTNKQQPVRIRFLIARQPCRGNRVLLFHCIIQRFCTADGYT